MTKSILFATSNKGKEREIRRILDGVSALEVKFLDDFPDLKMDPPEENGRPFDENALIKAKYYKCHFPFYFAAGEDSGLCVDHLDGAPGAHSARYKGLGDDAEKAAAVLSRLEGVPAKDRTARFIAVIALVNPAGSVEIFRGSVEGTISSGARGEGGFGYDPIFIPEGDHRTFAEMPAEEKDRLSHRRKALIKLKEFLLGDSR